MHARDSETGHSRGTPKLRKIITLESCNLLLFFPLGFCLPCLDDIETLPLSEEPRFLSKLEADPQEVSDHYGAPLISGEFFGVNLASRGRETARFSGSMGLHRMP